MSIHMVQEKSNEIVAEMIISKYDFSSIAIIA